jgi:plasmid stabilization system protein ParE
MKRMIFLACCAALVSAQTPAPLHGPLVSTGRWPRTTTLAEWTADVMRIEGLEKASETAQGQALFEWARLFNRMAVGGMIQAYEGDYGKERYVTDIHKNAFVYGWGYCDTTSRFAEAAWQEYKRDARAAQRVITQHEDGGYHTMYRLRMDGRYGAFDPRYGYFLRESDAPGARILDWSEVGEDARFHGNLKYANRSRPYFEIQGVEWERALLIEPGWFESETAWRAAGAPKEHVFADSHYGLGTRFHDMDFTLPRGATIERVWTDAGNRFYVPAGQQTRREFPFLAAGRYYRVTEASHGGNWPKHDPNYQRAKPYLTEVPRGQGYPADLEGSRTVGQAWGRLSYRPDLTRPEFFDALTAGATLVHAAAAPHLRAPAAGRGGEAVFRFRVPYVLVEGALEVELAGAQTRLELRVQKPKNASAAGPDEWTAWQTVAHGAGRRRVELGRARFNGSLASIHGAYAFELRLNVPAQQQPAGLSALSLQLDFENGVMSIPQIFAGRNSVRFAARETPSAPVTVTWRYRTAAGAREHRHTLRPADFRSGQASYTLDAPGLQRCDSVAVAW